MTSVEFSKLHQSNQEMQLIRVLIVFSPPTIYFEYNGRASDEQAKKIGNENDTRNKRILLNSKFLFDENLKIDLIASQIHHYFPCFFSNEGGMLLVQLKSLLRKMRMNKKLLDTFSGQNRKNKNSEKVNLKKAKEAMGASFNRNRIQPNSKDYQYDVRVDFDMVSRNSWDG